jgi:protein-tyrosine phosphatase
MNSFPNFRDLGGRAACDGRKIKSGLIYRSGQVGKLTKGELQTLLSHGIRTVLDLRSARESLEHLPAGGATIVGLPIELEDKYQKRVRPLLYRRHGGRAVEDMVASLYAELVTDQRHTVRRLFEILASQDRYPLLVHCRAGQDRTGFVSAVVLLSLGVDKKDIVADYLLSIGYSVPKVRIMAIVVRALTLGFLSTDTFEAAFTAHERYVRAIFGEIESKFRTIEGYLESCGVSRESLRRFKEIVLA